MVPPSPEAIKRLIADLREVVNSKDPTMYVISRFVSILSIAHSPAHPTSF
jgi:hypothetical protein